MDDRILHHYLEEFRGGGDVGSPEADTLFDALIASQNEFLVAELLAAWNQKGVTEDEIYAFACIMRARMKRINSLHNRLVDVVGTGGSRAKTFNVSTAAAFVVAGAGVPVAKHGNRSATSVSGSADVLAQLGVNVEADPDASEQHLNELGICFMFAPRFHSLSPTLAKARRSVSGPSIFNILGPLCNPASAPNQVIGVWHRDLVEKTANVLARLGTTCSWVVHGSDGLDELTLSGVTHAAEASEGQVRIFDLEPDDLDVKPASIEHLRVSSAEESAVMIRSILQGDHSDRAAVDLVLINAALPVFLSSVADTLSYAYIIARESLSSGAALSKLNELAAATNK